MVELIKPDVAYVTGLRLHATSIPRFRFAIPLKVLAKKPDPYVKRQAIINYWQAETNVLLYGEPHPDNKENLETVRHD